LHRKHSFLVVPGLALLLAACAAGPGAKTAEDANATPTSLLADGDAALERGDLPEAAVAYRRAAEASDDETVAEQATRVAFDNFQMRETARAADRWLQINPTSEQAHRYAGVAALRLHQLDAAEHHFAELLDSAYISPAAGYLALYPIVADEGSAPDVTQLFTRLSAKHPDVAGRALRGRRCRFACREFRAGAVELATCGRARILLAARQDAACACADRERPG
jgi:hypothetical protein